VADESLADLAAAVKAIRERIAARYPSGEVTPVKVPLVDLAPLLYARDAQEAKVAAIGSVNPRRPGFVNDIIQSVKRALARSLNWLVRPQTEFNRASVAATQTTIDALNEVNRLAGDLAIVLSQRMDALERRLEAAEQQASALTDVHSHWIEWRREWEHKLAKNEVQYLRAAADLQADTHKRLADLEDRSRTIAARQHADYLGALDRTNIELQKKVSADLSTMEQGIRLDFLRLIHEELRTFRQRAAALSFVTPAVAPAAPAPAADFIDSLRFAQRFRGSEEYVSNSFRGYLERYKDAAPLLDIGCGRGEFLTLAHEAGIASKGIDLSQESVAYCRSKGLDAEVADLFEYLAKAPLASLGGIFCSQVVEHLPADRLPEFIRLAAAALRPGGIIGIETPNPQCLAIFATHFYLDPTHTRPVPAPLLAYYLEEEGFAVTSCEFRNPPERDWPSLKALPEEVRRDFFNGFDSMTFAQRL
jgi:SAM-dependent methyltransferase